MFNLAFRLYQLNGSELEQMMNDANRVKDNNNMSDTNGEETTIKQKKKYKKSAKATTFEILVGLFVFGYCLAWNKFV